MLQQSRLPRSWTQGGDVTKGSALETASLRLAGVEPWKVVAGSAGVSLAIAYLYSLTQVTWNLPSWRSASHLLTLETQGRQPLTARLRARFFQLVRKIPAVKKHVSHCSFDSSSLNIGCHSYHSSLTSMSRLKERRRRSGAVLRRSTRKLPRQASPFVHCNVKVLF